MKNFSYLFLSLLLFWPFAVVQGSSSVDINTAPLKELEKIIGIGPVLGQRIIDARPFGSLDDLIEVKGIGEKTLQKIKDQGLAWASPKIKLEQEPTLQEKTAVPKEKPVYQQDDYKEEQESKPGTAETKSLEFQNKTTATAAGEKIKEKSANNSFLRVFFFALTIAALSGTTAIYVKNKVLSGFFSEENK